MRRGYGVGLLILIAGLLLRMFLLADTNATLDDLYTVTILKQASFLEAWYRKILVEPHPPLYNAVAYLWAHVFGDTLVSLHMLSTVFGAGVLMLLYARRRDVLGEDAFLIYFSLAALAPVGFINVLEIRSYSILFPAALVSSLYFMSLCKGVGRSSRSDLVMYSLFATITAFSHYFGTAVVFFQIFYLVCVSVFQKERPAWGACALLAAPVVASLAWLVYHAPLIKNNKVGSTWIYPTGIKYMVGHVGQFFGMPVARIGSSNDPQSLSFLLSSPADLLNIAAALILPVALLVLVILNRKELRRKLSLPFRPAQLQALGLLYMSIVPFMFFFVVGRVVPIVNWKYMIGFVPSVWLLCAVLFGDGAASRRNATVAVTASALAGLLFFPGLLTIPRYELGKAIDLAVENSKVLHVSLILPRLIEYQYFLDDGDAGSVIWADVSKTPDALPDDFVTVYAHCKPTTDTAHATACVKKGDRILEKYEITGVEALAMAGVYRFRVRP